MNVAVIAVVLLNAAGDGVVAQIDSTPITRDAFSRRAEAFRAARRPLSADAILDSLLDEAVLADDARRSGLARDPLVSARIAGERRRVLSNALLARAAAAARQPSTDELRATFKSTSDFARLQMFQYASREEALAGKDRLGRGADLLRESKAARSATVAVKDADAPVLMRAQLESDVAAAVFQAKPGQLIGPVKSADLWVVAKVVELLVADDAAFESAKPAIAARAQQQLADGARQHLVQQLRARASVHLDEDFLSTARVLDASPAELEHLIATAAGQPVRYGEVVTGLRDLAGRGAGGHITSLEVKKQVASTVVDEHLLNATAVERGLDGDPGLRAEQDLVERGVLANAAAERIWRAAKDAKDARPEEALRRRVQALRAQASTKRDPAALQAVAKELR